MTATNLIYTTLNTWSMCVLLALLLGYVALRWHGRGFTAMCTQCSAKTWSMKSQIVDILRETH